MTTGSGGYLIEFRPVGGYVKVSALDPVSLQEVSIVGSPQVSQDILTRLAVRKLERKIADGRPRPSGGGSPPSRRRRPRGGGWWV